MADQTTLPAHWRRSVACASFNRPTADAVVDGWDYAEPVVVDGAAAIRLGRLARTRRGAVRRHGPAQEITVTWHGRSPHLIGCATAARRRSTRFPLATTADLLSVIDDHVPALATELGVDKATVQRFPGARRITTIRDGVMSDYDIWVDRDAGGLVIDGELAAVPPRLRRDALAAALLPTARRIGGAAAELCVAHELWGSALPRSALSAELHAHTHRLVAHVAPDRDAAVTTVERHPPTADALRRHQGRARLLRQCAPRSLVAQVAMAFAQAAMVYLPAAAVSDDPAQQARNLAGGATTGGTRGLLDYDTLRHYCHQVTDRWRPRQWLERRRFARFIALHGGTATAEAIARVAASIAAMGTEAALLADTAIRRLVTGLAGGVGEALTTAHQVAASDIANGAKAVARRDEAADILSAAQSRVQRTLMGSRLVRDNARLAAARRDVHDAAAQVAKLVSEHGFRHAALLTSAAPADTANPLVRWYSRVGPQFLAAGFSTMATSLLGNVAYSAMSLISLTQSSVHAALSRFTRRRIAADEARRAAAKQRRTTHELREATSTPLTRRELAVAALTPKRLLSRGQSLATAPRPVPYVLRALLTAPFTIAATAPLWLIDQPAIRILAAAALVAAALSPLATGLYWEADRLLDHLYGERWRGAELAQRALATVPKDADEAAAALEDERAVLMELANRIATVEKAVVELSEVVTPGGLRVGELINAVAKWGSLPLLERCCEGLRGATDIDEWLREATGGQRAPRRAARALRRRYEADTATIATAEYQLSRADNHLAPELRSASTLAVIPHRVANNPQYRALCEEIADPRLSEPTGRLVAAVVAACDGELMQRGSAVAGLAGTDVDRVRAGTPAGQVAAAIGDQRTGDDRPLSAGRAARSMASWLTTSAELSSYAAVLRQRSAPEARRPIRQP